MHSSKNALMRHKPLPATRQLCSFCKLSLNVASAVATEGAVLAIVLTHPIRTATSSSNHSMQVISTQLVEVAIVATARKARTATRITTIILNQPPTALLSNSSMIMPNALLVAAPSIVLPNVPTALRSIASAALPLGMSIILR